MLASDTGAAYRLDTANGGSGSGATGAGATGGWVLSVHMG